MKVRRLSSPYGDARDMQLLTVDLLATGTPKRVGLQFGCLAGGADPGVSDRPPALMFSKAAEHAAFRNKPIKNSSEKENVPQQVLCASRAGARQKRWFARNVER